MSTKLAGSADEFRFTSTFTAELGVCCALGGQALPVVTWPDGQVPFDVYRTSIAALVAGIAPVEESATFCLIVGTSAPTAPMRAPSRDAALRFWSSKNAKPN